MELNNLNHLIEKYFEGETSLAEESQLTKIFSSKEIPPELEVYRELFERNSALKKEELPLDFSSKVLGHIQKEERAETKSVVSLKSYLIRIAALFFLAASAFFLYQQNENSTIYASSMKDTEASPEEAYQEAKDALLLVSKKLFKGQKITEENVNKLKPLKMMLPNK